MSSMISGFWFMAGATLWFLAETVVLLVVSMIVLLVVELVSKIKARMKRRKNDKGE